MSSRELRDARTLLFAAALPLVATWEGHDKRVQLVAYRAFADTIEELADELEHPDYNHARAVRLAREIFDAGIALLAIVDEELRNTADACALRVTRGAALAFMETVAKYLSPFSGLRAA